MSNKIKNKINLEAIKKASETFKGAKPFDHCVVDNFFDHDFALKLTSEFPDFNDSVWYTYNNAIEIKKASNNWNAFPENTYQLFSYLNSPDFLEFLSKEFGTKFYPDFGLNGGGWHIHKSKGKLNTHYDYNIHPKLGLQRKLNIIMYMNPNWKEEWGGSVGLYSHDKAKNRPEKLITEVTPLFNRAVIFDTTQNSWHGFPDPINCPENEYRKSLAIYFLAEPAVETEQRYKALFAPSDTQKDDQEVLDLIKKRCTNDAEKVYIK